MVVIMDISKMCDELRSSFYSTNNKKKLSVDDFIFPDDQKDEAEAIFNIANEISELEENKKHALENIYKRHEEFEAILSDTVKSINENKKSINIHQAEIDKKLVELNAKLASFENKKFPG